jgi:hypothetical protein
MVIGVVIGVMMVASYIVVGCEVEISKPSPYVAGYPFL